MTNGNTRAHATLTETLTPYNAIATHPQIASQMESANGLIALNQQVVTQASWISYLNAFHLMMILTLATIPLILLARGAKQAGGAKPVIAE